MIMVVIVAVATVGVCMTVDMAMLVGVGQVAMAMGVGVDMMVLMGVLQGNGVLDHQHSCCDHNDQSEIKLESGPLLQQKDTEEHTKKGRDGIVCAGLGCTKILLCLDIEIDAQTVCHKSK